MILLVYIPLVYVLFFGLMLRSINKYEFLFFLRVLTQVFSICGITLGFARFCEKRFSNALNALPSPTYRTFFKYTLGGILGVVVISLIFRQFPVADDRPGGIPIPLGMFHVLMSTTLFASFQFILQQKQAQLELERNLKTSQFQALKAQLSPHFLFNTLNLISAEIEEDPQKANQILETLADLLRNVLRSASESTVSLAQEVHLIDQYLALQQQRFEEYLSYHIELPEDCKGYRVPPLLLQPLVENALVHGFSQDTSHWDLQVTIEKTERFLKLSVKDNGCGFDPTNATYGYGLSVIQDTLQLIYGGQQEVKIHSSPSHGTHIVLNLPLKVLHSYEGLDR